MKSIKADGCDAIFHTGNALAIGPYPAECLDLLLDTPNIRFVMGNHDSYFADGLPDPIPDTMSKGEVEAPALDPRPTQPKKRAVLAQWPYSLTHDSEGTKVALIHYGLAASGRDFTPTIGMQRPSNWIQYSPQMMFRFFSMVTITASQIFKAERDISILAL